jgi:hypothetical protein
LAILSTELHNFVYRGSQRNPASPWVIANMRTGMEAARRFVIIMSTTSIETISSNDLSNVTGGEGGAIMGGIGQMLSGGGGLAGGIGGLLGGIGQLKVAKAQAEAIRAQTARGQAPAAGGQGGAGQ